MPTPDVQGENADLKWVREEYEKGGLPSALVAKLAGISTTTAFYILTGETANPGVLTLDAVVSAIKRIRSGSTGGATGPTPEVAGPVAEGVTP